MDGMLFVDRIAPAQPVKHWSDSIFIADFDQLAGNEQVQSLIERMLDDPGSTWMINPRSYNSESDSFDDDQDELVSQLVQDAFSGKRGHHSFLQNYIVDVGSSTTYFVHCLPT